MIMKIHYTGAAETEEIKKELISGWCRIHWHVTPPAEKPHYDLEARNESYLSVALQPL
jgi:hypothetical protein